MSRYRLTEQARQDLDEIWPYIAKDNPNAADYFLDILYEKFVFVAR
jgi:plasmid stabilization system protein ParE